MKKQSDYNQKLLEVRRVTRVVSGGKRMSFRAAVVIGDGRGKVGLGIGKGLDVSAAIEKAARKAKKDLIEVFMVNGSIPYEVNSKFKGAKILLKPIKEGRGIITGSAVRAVCELAGINNVSGKILGTSKSFINNAKATLIALQMFDYLKVKKDKLVKVPEIEIIEAIEIDKV